MKLNTDQKKGEFSPLYLNPGDVAILTVKEGKAVKVAETTGKFGRPEHYALYLLAEINLEPDEYQPIYLEIYNGKLPSWNVAEKKIEFVDYEVAGLIWAQVSDPEFPLDGFKGEIKFPKDVKALKGSNPIKNLEPCEIKELPALPEAKNGSGRNYGPSFQPALEIFEHRKQWISQELKALLPEDQQNLDFSQLCKACGISSPSEYLDLLVKLTTV